LLELERSDLVRVGATAVSAEEVADGLEGQLFGPRDVDPEDLRFRGG
jgi:hypothetical protein